MGVYFTGLLTNRVLLAAVAGWTTAQVLKTLLVLLMEKELRLERLMGSGGMPSSHSAFVMAIAVSIGVLYGGRSPLFALAAAFALVVIISIVAAALVCFLLPDMIQLVDNMIGILSENDQYWTGG